MQRSTIYGISGSILASSFQLILAELLLVSSSSGARSRGRLGIMGLLAAMLAVTGIFGMAAYRVSRRVRELGLRVALGAHRAQLMRSALGRPLVLLASGSVVGLLLGLITSPLSHRSSIRPPPRSSGARGVVAAMMLIGLVATWIPAPA